ncbi:RHS repeat-associated core domain-containing protein [Pseudomonas xantholysinigenes]|uniref:RHS repeat-associated core domain-containing protein n=1 Tax=Pseudomonas xantholysinigenes TaxID=2745490 RepID=A0A9E6PZE1_9PSED|nr:RHS repeat-associated core domain-containing protein [Pseudomonas xantholysinigenes]QXI39702.1 RHS repeat-associated core domain-containing protein [Pseudomonas xantholysinigenes]
MVMNYLAACDQQHSVLASAGIARGYTPYGALPLITGGRLGYVGQLREALHGLYHLGNGYRSYAPYLMRFLSPDALSPFGKGGINAYAYCAGDPINHQDRNGRTRDVNPHTQVVQALGHGKIPLIIHGLRRLKHMAEVAVGKNPHNVSPPGLRDFALATTSVIADSATLIVAQNGFWGNTPSGGQYYDDLPDSVVLGDMHFDMTLANLVMFSYALDAYAEGDLHRFTADEITINRPAPTPVPFEEVQAKLRGDSDGNA